MEISKGNCVADISVCCDFIIACVDVKIQFCLCFTKKLWMCTVVASVDPRPLDVGGSYL